MGLDVFFPIVVPVDSNVPMWYILVFYVVVFAVFEFFLWLLRRR